MIKRVFVFAFLVLLLTGAFVEAGWGDISNGGNETPVGENTSKTTQTSSGGNYASGNYGSPETKYTMNFYIAVGVGTFVVLLILYIAYLFIRGPSVKWKKSKPIKQ